MKTIIFGAGKLGKKILSLLYKDVIALADNNQCILGTKIENIEIIGIEMAAKLIKTGKADKIIICVMSEREQTKIALQLMQYDVKASGIYIAPPYLMDNDYVGLGESDLLYNKIKPLKTVKPTLDYLEVWVSESCNLNCKGCGYFCNFVPENSFPSFDQYKKDINRMAELFNTILKIRLMGGEPLLNAELEKYLYETRKVFPYADIDIVTNGLQILNMNEKLCEMIRFCRAALDISYYPVLEDKKLNLESWLYAQNIKYSFSPKIDLFYKRICPDGQSDPIKANDNCIAKTCHFMRNGKIAHCGFPLSVDRLNQHYDLNIRVSETDIIDLYDSDMDAWQMCFNLENAIPMCAYCAENVEYFPWEAVGRKNVNLYDYVIEHRV